MNRKTTKILAILALDVQALGVMLAVVVMFLQNRLLPSLMGWTPKDTGIVFPVVLFSMVVQLVIYLIFVSSLQNKGNERNIALCITLVAVSVLFSLASTWIETFGIVLYSRKGADALAKYSGVSQLVSYVRQGCGVPAVALFYLACGRYTVKAGD